MNLLPIQIGSLLDEIKDIVYESQSNKNLDNDSGFSSVCNLSRKINISISLMENGYDTFSWQNAENTGILCLNDYLIFEELFDFEIPKVFERKLENLKKRNPKKLVKRENSRNNKIKNEKNTSIKI